MHMDINKRIYLARREAGMTQDQLAEAVGKTRSAVAQWESGEVRPRHSTMVAIARATGRDLRWLESGHEYNQMFLPAVGEVAAGTWKEGSVEYRPIALPVMPIPDFPSSAQRLYRVSGTSLNMIASDGDYLHALDIHAAGVAPKNGDLVVVRRMHQGLTEYTAKRLRIAGDRRYLMPESLDPQWKDPLVIDGDESTEIEITDVVLAVWSPIYRQRSV